MLGDTQTVVNSRVGPGGVKPCGSADVGGGNTAELLHGLRAVLRQSDELLPLPVQLGVAALRDELGINEALDDDRVRHRVDHRDIGAGQQLQVMFRLDVR